MKKSVLFFGVLSGLAFADASLSHTGRFYEKNGKLYYEHGTGYKHETTAEQHRPHSEVDKSSPGSVAEIRRRLES